MTKLLNDDIIKQIREVFDGGLKNPVHVMFFGKVENCEYCDETRQLVEEVTAISDLFRLSTLHPPLFSGGLQDTDCISSSNDCACSSQAAWRSFSRFSRVGAPSIV